ncbi:GntR family transcriptional regulator [Austwickia chelonae]|uniref:Putative GntR family transcriptional regulator n=1 Tax=Austwickia chelonae NBRC 105200 TaxID=1184607 RepID=K6VSF2_9MICO|nr:GntR family transcriptional regulator [Austwickia chelonae]GAB78275.1 putative GntR family transcriptional regulator [Austwickia chelonae NBRC 105200]SEW00236.1 GntR family transcriptional regulator [Austwickia chelonae]
MTLSITLSNTTGQPIYEQIREQIQAAILAGQLAPGHPLPSIRGLAKDLQVSVITTTRAYSDLAALGLITNVPGKGSYVLDVDTAALQAHVRDLVHRHFLDGVRQASRAGLSPTELHSLLDAAIHSAKDLR